MTEDLSALALLCFTSLIAISNPLSATPMCLALTAGYTPEHRRRTLRNAMLTAFAVLVVFALLGGTIFQIFGITIHAFRIAGGIIFFGIGTDMLQAKRSRVKATQQEEEGRHKEDVGITPLGSPMITGPGAITTVKNGDETPANSNESRRRINQPTLMYCFGSCEDLRPFRGRVLVS